MTLDLGAIAGEAWAVARRDRAILVPLAAVFLFLPTLALLLFVPAPPTPPRAGQGNAETMLFIDAYRRWISDYGVHFLVTSIVAAFGGVSIMALYLDRGSATLGDAMARALVLLPRYLLASVMVMVPAIIGLLMLVVPGLYVLGRTMLVGPVLVAERPGSAVAAIVKALSLSHRRGWVLAGVATIALVAQQMLPAPLLAIDDALHRMRAANQLVIIIVDAGAAALTAAVALGLMLFRIALYRRLA